MILGLDASRVAHARMTGTERYAREVLRALLRLAPKHEIRLYTRQAESATALNAAQAEVVHIRRARMWTHLGLGNEIMKRPPDALFIPAHVLPLHFALRHVRARTRAVVTVHDCGFRHFPDAHTATQRLYLEWSTSFAAKHAHALLADSDATMQDLHHFYSHSRGKVFVAHPGAPSVLPASADQIAEACARIGVRPGRYLLHIGTQQPRKNLRRMIDAFAAARTQLKQADHLVLAGGAGWGSEDLTAHAGTHDARNAVVFTGYITDEDKAALLHGARALVFPSLYEGFGFPVLEAQIAGVPVACSNTSSLPEAAGDAARSFNPLDTRDIAAAIIDVTCDDALRSTLIERGRRNTTRFTWEACARTALRALTGEEP